MNLYLYNLCMLALNAGKDDDNRPSITLMSMNMNGKKYQFSYDHLKETWTIEQIDLNPDNFFEKINSWENMNQEMAIETVNYIFGKGDNHERG